jgi:hypothetical protein
MILLEGTRADARAFAMMDLSSFRIPSCLWDVSSVPWLTPGLARSELTEYPLLRCYLVLADMPRTLWHRRNWPTLCRIAPGDFCR